MAARQLTSILLFASLFVTATSRQTRNRQTSPTETAAQSHLIAASIDSKHLLRDDDLAVIKNMIATTENNDPEVEESEASRIGYITDQQRSQSSCKSCSLEKKHSGNDHLRGKTLKSSVNDSRSSNKNDHGSTTSNDMRASQGSNNAKESALHKVQDAEIKVEDAQSKVEDLRSEISKESHPSSDDTVNQALENAENELAEAEEKESETKLDAQDVGATSDETDAAERGDHENNKR